MLKNIASTCIKVKSDLIHLVFPETCFICKKELPNSNIKFCSFCENELCLTYFEKYKEPTPLDKLFWGRLPLHRTYAWLYFEKQKSTQAILHQLKYKNDPELAVEIGKKIGKIILNNAPFDELDALLPIPLHPKKKFVRGYNQSEKLAEGIGEVWRVPVYSQILQRNKNTKSQTKKSKTARWEDVQNVFSFTQHHNLLKWKHIAVVDDVITTGSTLEITIQQVLQRYPHLNISIICLAVAK